MLIIHEIGACAYWPLYYEADGREGIHNHKSAYQEIEEGDYALFIYKPCKICSPYVERIYQLVGKINPYEFCSENEGIKINYVGKYYLSVKTLPAEVRKISAKILKMSTAKIHQI